MCHETRTLFIDDFGTLVNQTDRTTSSYVPVSNYTYKPSGKEIRDGHYAVVTTPRFAGCGTQTGAMLLDVTLLAIIGM